MPSIAERTVPLDETKYQRLDPAVPQKMPGLDISNNNLAPGLNATLRSGLPPIYAATDNLRQFYVGGQIPQYRVLPTAPLKSS